MIGSNLLHGKSRIIIIIITFIFYQFWLQSLSRNWIEKTIIEDSDGTWSQLETLRAILIIWRLFAVGGAIIGILGLIGLYKEKLSLFRILAFHSFLSILGDCILLLVVLLVLTTSSHSSNSFSSSLCETIGNADLSNSFDFGWSIETCEDTYRSVIFTMFILISIIIGFRIWLGFGLYGYYKGMIKRLRGGGSNTGGGGRKPILGINTTGSSSNRSERSSERERYSDLQQSPGNHKSSGQRIFLLPSNTSNNSSGSGDMLGEGSNSIPMVSITTPTTSSAAAFSNSSKSHPFNLSSTPNSLDSSNHSSEAPFLVYQPVLMSAEQARSLFAKEITVAGTSGRILRSRSNTGPSSSTTPLITTTATTGTAIPFQLPNNSTSTLMTSSLNIAVAGGILGEGIVGLLPGITEETYSKGKLA